MRSRRRRARAIAWLLAAGFTLTPLAATAQSFDGFPVSRFVEVREPLFPQYPIHRFLIAREASAQTERVVNTTHAAVALLSDWFNWSNSAPPPITVAGVPWRGSFSGSVRPGMVTAPLRWLTPVRDQSTERALIGGLVRWSWTGGDPPDSSFDEAIVVYLGTHAVHQLLEGSNFAAARSFGGLVPFPLRSLLLSPPVADPRPRVWGFEELFPPGGESEEVRRGVKALQTLERYVGWPTMLEAISTGAVRLDAGAFATALSEVRGTDMRSLVAECLRPDAVFDYSLDGLESAPGATGLVETTVTINRRGSGRFTLGNGEKTMPVLVRFADGTETRDYFDGAASSTTLVYSAKAPAVRASIDPDVMLLLDTNRENNAIVRDAPRSLLGVRLALHWMTWLQNTMLSYTALL